MPSCITDLSRAARESFPTEACLCVRSHEFTPHAPCCQESDSRSTWGALALRATSRCLFTHPIPERRHWRHFWTSKETPSWALALEQAFAPWTAVWPLPPRQGATFCLDHLFFLGQFGLMVCSGRSLRHDNLWKVCAHPPCWPMHPAARKAAVL